MRVMRFINYLLLLKLNEVETSERKNGNFIESDKLLSFRGILFCEFKDYLKSSHSSTVIAHV